MGTRLRANPPEGNQDIEDTNSANHSSKRWMKHDGHERRKMAEKIILLPIAGPRQIEKQRAHLERKHNQQCAINPAHL